MNKELMAKSSIFLFNLSVLLLYFLNLDVGYLSLKLVLYSLLFLNILALVTIKGKNRVVQFFHNFQITCFSIILTFLLIELIARVKPDWIPVSVRYYLAKEDVGKVRAEMVEYLTESPFVKFRPNTVIRSQGYRGLNEQFVYQWKTDNLGFKNLEAVAHSKQVDIVIVGDSFTEGMGVAVEDTVASILTSSGYTTYNLGVQGYSPIQLEGSLRQYGLQFKPKYIIIGYTAGTFGREREFIDVNRAVQNKEFTGGIQSSVESIELRSQAKYMVSAFFLMAQPTFKNFVYNLKPLSVKYDQNRLYKKYKNELLVEERKDGFDEDIKRDSIEWRNTLRAFDNIIGMAQAIHAQVILLYFPARRVVYYEAAMRRPRLESYPSKVEADALEKYAAQKNIGFLDPTEKLVSYVNQLDLENIAVKDLPYLEVDGHMSRKGYELTADAVVEYLKIHETK